MNTSSYQQVSPVPLTADYEADAPPPEYTYQSNSSIEFQSYNDDHHLNSLKSGISKAIKYFSKWYRIAGLIITIFFSFYMILLFSFFYKEYSIAKKDHAVLSVPASVPALHWVLCLVAVTFGIFLMLTNHKINWKLTLFAFIVFVVFWIINGAVVSQTSVYKAAKNPITLQAYNELTNAPYSMIRIHGTYTTIEYYYSKGEQKSRIVTRHCYSPYVTLFASNWTDNSHYPNVSNIDTELSFISISSKIAWEDESELRIKYLLDQYLKEMKASGSRCKKWKQERTDSIDDYLDSLVVSEKGLTGVLSRPVQVALSIFWSPAAFIYKLAAESYYEAGSLVKTNCVMTQTPSFSQFSMSC
ncbi:hypothetical protein GPJ56_006090 [Histomonas meleagridis]|uniref:uncharacterized protein n=1 Tax=Histomonas meleagridis TaxID=135588 RepID=UPI0035594F3D|nr:hypothetical protein GPJ56_006090 [Histomonas meleagridis]KAH0807197.1 hypothetical protein GO595_000373 [Histomonas meleagridis]